MESKQRHGCATAWLIVMIIGNSLTATVYLFASELITENSTVPISDDMILFMGMVGVLNLLFAVMLLQWKKWAFWGIAATTSITFATNLSLGLGVSNSILGFLGIIALFGILQIKKDGISTWDNLE